MTNPEYVNPGHVLPDSPDAEAQKREAYERQQEVAARNPLNTEPDIVTNARAEQAAEDAKAEAKDVAVKPAKRTGASNK